MSDEFKDKKLKKENEVLWHRYLSQEGLVNDATPNEDFESLLDAKRKQTGLTKNRDIVKSVNKVAPTTSNSAISSEIDKRTDQKLRQGKLPIDARLDLHGLRSQEAHKQVIGFIEQSYQYGRRTVLVITGKGRSLTNTSNIIEPEVGVLKQNFPVWLNEDRVRNKILKIYPAHKKHGGTGAFYVYLRKKK